MLKQAEFGSSGFGPIPLIVGVAGHRRLPDAQLALRGVVRDLLLDFRNRYPSTRIVLLSALAEGADRLVAREALELGFSLVVPLPMAREEYEKDFATPESLAEFRSLLLRAESVFVVRPVVANLERRRAGYGVRQLRGLHRRTMRRVDRAMGR